MTDRQTLLQQAERCRRLANVCVTEIIARKFEALARDYEEHARLLDRDALSAGALQCIDGKDRGGGDAAVPVLKARASR